MVSGHRDQTQSNPGKVPSVPSDLWAQPCLRTHKAEDLKIQVGNQIPRHLLAQDLLHGHRLILTFPTALCRYLSFSFVTMMTLECVSP